MPVTKELVQSVRRRIAANPGLRTDLLADELRASEAEVITCLPLDMRLRARNTAFEAIWNIICRWKNITVNYPRLEQAGHGIADGHSLSLCRMQRPGHTGDGKFQSPFNPEDVGYIWFVSQPLLNEQSHSVRFFDKLGRHILSVYICRDRSGSFDAAVMADYEAMRRRFGVIPMPKNRCKGCSGCTCNAANDSQQREIV